MTDVELVQKAERVFNRLLRIVRRRSDLLSVRCTLPSSSLALQRSLRLLNTLSHTSRHTYTDDRLGEPRSNRALFEILEEHGWIDGMTTLTLKNMVGFRNLVVHGYAAVDPRVVKDVVENHVDDLLQFVAAIRQKLETSR